MQKQQPAYVNLVLTWLILQLKDTIFVLRKCNNKKRTKCEKLSDFPVHTQEEVRMFLLDKIVLLCYTTSKQKG